MPLPAERESLPFPDILESVGKLATPDAIWLKDGAEKRASVQRMFADIAPTYDRLNGLMSISQHGRWRGLAVQKLELKPGDRALDVCCGTGDFMVPLGKAVGEKGLVYGVDFCLPMLSLAMEKITGEVALGDACRLPIASAAFNAVSVGWGIRNVPDIDGAHKEIFRVLKPGGRFVSLDMAQPANGLVRAFSSLFNLRIVPMMGAMFGKREAYTYLPKSTERFKTREELKASMERTGFVDVSWKNLMMGNICIHWGRKP